MIVIRRKLSNKQSFDISLYSKDNKYLGKIYKVLFSELIAGRILNEVVLNNKGEILINRMDICDLLDQADYFVLSNNTGVLMSIRDIISLEGIKNFTGRGRHSKEVYSRDYKEKSTNNDTTKEEEI